MLLQRETFGKRFPKSFFCLSRERVGIPDQLQEKGWKGNLVKQTPAEVSSALTPRDASLCFTTGAAILLGMPDVLQAAARVALAVHTATHKPKAALEMCPKGACYACYSDCSSLEMKKLG